MDNKIKVSIVIPVYNTEKYLKQCLDSVLMQGLDNIEIICVNDGSTDSSVCILEEYAAMDSRVVTITQENQGPSCARNAGIQFSKGKYICFLDSDDMLADNALVELYKMAEEKQLEILCYDASCFYESEQLEKNEYKDDYYNSKKSYSEIKTGKELFCDMVEADDFCDSACLLFINRKWLEKEDIFFVPNIIHEDCMFVFECFMRAHRIEHINNPYLKYRVRPQSIMTTKANSASLRGRTFCYTAILRYLLNNELSDRERNAIVKFEKLIIYSIKWTDYGLDDIERDKCANSDPLEQLIWTSMGVGLEGKYGISENIYLRGFNDLLDSFDNIVLYGAGRMGRKVYQYIKEKGYDSKVLCFAVSKKNIDNEHVGNVLVKEISEVRNEERTLVIVSARRDYQEDMLRKAKNLGFENIEIIDLRMEKIIAKQLQREF